MIENTLILITDNDEKNIEEVLDTIIPLDSKTEIIIFDNCSKDDTVPKIVSKMGILWTDKNKRYNFFISTKKQDIEVIVRNASKKARGKVHIIDVKKSKYDRVVAYVKD